MIKKLLIISSLLIVSVAGAEKKEVDEWKVTGRLNAYVEDRNTVGKSSDREGTTHNEELNLNFYGPFANGKAGVESRLRTTNDRNIQKDGAELLYLKAFYKDKTWLMEAGDVAASLNSYIFSGSLKGAKAVYKSDKKDHKWDYTIIGGYKKALWREVYTEEEGEAPTGYSGAFNAKYIYERAKEVSFTFSALDTDLATGDLDSNVSEAKNGYGFGVDGKWRFNKYITLKGKAALTDGKKDKRVDKGVAHTALYLKLLTRPVLKSVKSNFVYQRVDSDFVSFGGSANDDKEQIENSTTWRINKELKARFDLKYNRDNLDGSLSDTKDLYYEAAVLTYYPSFLKRGDFNFRVSNKDIRGREVGDTITAGVDFNLRQKSGWRYGAGYDYSDNDSNTTSTRSHIIKALLGYKQKLSKTSSYRFAVRPNYQIIENSQDKIGLKVDAGYVYSKYLDMDILYMINDTNYDDSTTSKDTQNATYQFRTTYKLDAKGKNLVRLLLEKRDSDIKDDSQNSYNEYIGKVSLVMNF